jgi:ubiquinone biosynthesis protein UbiJ
VADAHGPHALAAVRDFAASVVEHASADPAAHAEDARPHVHAVRTAVDALEARVKSLFGKR